MLTIKLSFVYLGELDKTCIAEYAEVLKANYQKQSLPAEGLLEHSSKICRLAMIQREKLRRHEINNEFVQQTITGKVDDILHMKTPVELKSIFKGVPSDRKVVLIEGAPGAGKSSLSLNICKKWSDGDLFQEYTAVILVRLRDPCIQAATLIAELLPHCEKGVSKKVGSVILATEGENILWVLDGWDEFPEHLKKDEKCLVRNLIYQQSHSSSVIVTSRPISSVALHSLVSKRIEILGFTVDELQQYFEYRLKGDTKSVEILLQKIKEYPEVHSSCYLPLHAGFIADTFLMNKQDLPGTQYGIFETVVMKCISRHQIKQGKEEITSLVNVESVIKENIVAICKLAYKGILENKIIFTNQDLPISGFKSLDLLQEVESMVVFQGRVSRTYNFLHLSIQEFLAAQELARRPKHEQYWLFRGLMEDDRCLPMLTFYAAKTKLTAPGIANFVSTVGDRYLQATKEHEREQLCGLLAFVFKCICETEDPSLCKPLVKALDGQFFGISHIYDYYSLGSFLSLSSCAPSGCDNRIMIGDIERSVIQNHEWALFLKGLLRFYKGKCVSVLETGDLTVRSSDPILDLLKHMQLSIRHLYIWDGYVRRISKRKSLHNSLDVSTPWLIADLLKSDNIVSSLKVRGIKVSHEFIAEGLRLNTRLRELHLVQCNITSLGLQFLCEGLYRNMSLRILDLSNNPLADGVECLSDMFKRNTTLDDLNLNNCQLNSHHLSTIKSFGNLKVLSLSCNGIGNKGAKYLTKALDVNRTLQMLVVTKCGITAHGSTSLLNVFQNGSLHTLKTMHIDSAVEETMPELPSFYSGYQVYPGRSSQFHSATTSTFNEKSLIQVTINLNGGMILSRLIKHGYPLQTLVISSKDVDFDVLNSIFEVLKYNTNLKYFQVVNGGMNGLNFKTIAESLKENKTLLTVMLDNDLRDYNTGYRNTWRRQTDNMSAISNLLQYVAECFRFNHTLQFLRIPPQCDNHVFKQLLYRCMYRGSVKLLHNQNDFEQSFSHGYEDLISDTVSI